MEKLGKFLSLYETSYAQKSLFQTIQTIFCNKYLEEKKKLSEIGQDQKRSHPYIISHLEIDFYENF